jgi:outer membrane protein
LFSAAGGAPPSSGSSPAGDGLVPAVANWDVGLALSWPILDEVLWGQRAASRDGEGVRQADVEVAEQLEWVAVRNALARAVAARAAIPDLAEAVEAARANEAEAEERFREGVGTSVELADAEAVRTDSEINLALGKLDFARARAALDRATATEEPP